MSVFEYIVCNQLIYDSCYLGGNIRIISVNFGISWTGKLLRSIEPKVTIQQNFRSLERFSIIFESIVYIWVQLMDLKTILSDGHKSVISQSVATVPIADIWVRCLYKTFQSFEIGCRLIHFDMSRGLTGSFVSWTICVHQSQMVSAFPNVFG